MSLPSIYIKARFALIVCLMVWAGPALPAQAQTVMERLVSPGTLSEPHQEFEKNCKACHTKFNKNKQTSLCLDCHKKIAVDVRGTTGFHGKFPDVKGQTCKSCHTEHEGLAFKTIDFTPDTFDHTFTDYPLAGKHKTTKCAQCHIADKKYRDAPTACVNCHKAKEPHKGNLGANCTSCHNVSDWKQVKFDHGKTKFSLLGKHKETKCSACHINEIYKGIPTVCVDCHIKKDTHKGKFGTDCASCHTSLDWKKTTFQHRKRTGFSLTGTHTNLQCAACHTQTLQKPKLKQTCATCHTKDDSHKGRNGPDCAACHKTSNWKTTKFNHDTNTKFSLKGAHISTSCEACHLEAVTKTLPGTTCIDCHKKDDDHKGLNGLKCASCHNNVNWKQTSFDHNSDTKFSLRGGHIALSCESCHLTPIDQKLPGTTCVDCHKNDDPHKNSLGVNCVSCHNEASWTENTRIDHDFTRFPLLGKHNQVECKDCHTSKKFQDASTDCVSCHVNDDEHKGKLGDDCGLCHNPNNWSLWIFNHTSQTKFPLTGSHEDLNCAACHRRTLASKQSPTCVSCHRADDKHRGQYGKDCSRCHTTTTFKAIKFP
jgi:hypothetical protein